MSYDEYWASMRHLQGGNPLNHVIAQRAMHAADILIRRRVRNAFINWQGLSRERRLRIINKALFDTVFEMGETWRDRVTLWRHASIILLHRLS